VWKLIEGQPLRCASMAGLPTGRLADLIGRVREIVSDEWEKPLVGRPRVFPLPTAVIAVLFELRHNMPDEVMAEVFGCSQATITRYHQILPPILRWATRPEVDQRLERTRRDGVLVDGFLASVGERESYHGPFSGKKHVSGQNVQVIADLDGRRTSASPSTAPATTLRRSERRHNAHRPHRASRTPDPGNHCRSRSPMRPRSRTWTSVDMTASAASSTNRNMPLDLHRRGFGTHRPALSGFAAKVD